MRQYDWISGFLASSIEDDTILLRLYAHAVDFVERRKYEKEKKRPGALAVENDKNASSKRRRKVRRTCSTSLLLLNLAFNSSLWIAQSICKTIIFLHDWSVWSITPKRFPMTKKLQTRRDTISDQCKLDMKMLRNSCESWMSKWLDQLGKLAKEHECAQTLF